MASSSSLIFLLLTLTYFNHIMASNSNCSPAPDGMDITEQAYNSDIVVKAKVTGPGKENHTALVTDIFGTKSGGLIKKKSVITFGPLKKAKECPRIKKNAEYILFLEAESEDSFYKIKYNPVSKRSFKKLKKVLCENCFKTPKFKGKDKKKSVQENTKFQFKCKATGEPKPVAVFLKDGVELPKKAKGMKITISKKGGGGRLKINSVKKEHEGKYTCRVTSFLGTADLSYTLTIKEIEEPDMPVPVPDRCIECGPEHKDLCVQGHCCMVPVVNDTSCRCDEGFHGRRCEIKNVPQLPRSTINIIEARYHKQTIAIMGVCIALLIVVFICYVVYCKFKKSRSHIRKEIIARNGHAGGRTSGVPAADQPITNADNVGILGDDARSGVGGIEMTGYRSTNLTTEAAPIAFAQFPQTYDDVILSAPSGEGQLLIHQQRSSSDISKHGEAEDRDNTTNSRARRTESDNRRRRKKGVAIGRTDHHQSASDMDNSRAPRRVGELKQGQQSMSSSASSLASHDLKRPVIPLDERFIQNIVNRGMEVPPAYTGFHDVTDSRIHEQTADDNGMNQHAEHSISSHSDIQPDEAAPMLPTGLMNRERDHSSMSSGSAHKVTTFDTDGRIEEQMLERDDGALQGVTPHSPIISPQNSTPRSPMQNIYQAHITQTPSLSSTASDMRSGSYKMSPHRKLPYQNRNVSSSSSAPYYEHNLDSQGGLNSPNNDNDDIFMSVGDAPEPSSQFYSNGSQRHNVPGSPTQYQPNPEMSMGIPYRHAPVTVASAHHHHLPLLTNDLPADIEKRASVGSAVSLPSSSNSSLTTERNRDSHKIEV